ncbi:MAG: transferrin-binding protein-like solute binding protein [Betaproteobacteria bacterium]
MKLYLRLAAAAVTTVLLSGGSCSSGRDGFSGETPPVAEPAQPASPPPSTEPAPAEAPPSPPPPDQSATPAPGPAPSQPPVNFTSFSAVQPNQTVVAPTVSNAARVTAQQQGADERVTSFFTESLNWHGAGAQLTYDSTGALSGIRLEASPSDTLNFQRSAGDTVSCSGAGSCSGSNGTQNVVLFDPAIRGWNYQTFGVWGSETMAPSGRIGAVSIGAVTPSDAVPVTGTGTFTGRAMGFYIDAAGNPYATRATLSALVNFASRSIAFTTSGTQISNGAATAMPGLNLSGTLTYAPNQNISGPVQTQNGALTGNADGRFYGPKAEEIGGVYSLSGSGMNRMIGGFGGRR